MLFHTLNYAIFLLITFFVFWFIIPKNVKFQNAFLVLVSYVFYSFWDYRFLALLAFSTLLDFLIGLKLHATQKSTHRKIWLWVSIGINLGVLGFFKYYNFFIDSLTNALNGFNVNPSIPVLQIIIPVGISFYTFHGISYILDVYHKRIEPTNDFNAYSLFVSFFPLLVAGPIERATHLLPQLKKVRVFDYHSGVKGVKQILWGLFKKMVIADNCQALADYTFNNHTTLPGSVLAMGALFFSFQIYCDFSGYTDIAIGTGRLFGIELLKNFSFPYFSRNIFEFWKRWHISLTSWFRDYVYIPLGGNRVSFLLQIRNVLIIFLLSGFWHGANWTFIVWGLLNALVYITYMIYIKNVKPSETKDNLIVELVKIGFNFMLVSVLWIFFRSKNLTESFEYITGIFNPSILEYPLYNQFFDIAPLVILLLMFFVLIEWIGKNADFAIENLLVKSPVYLKFAFWGFIVFLIGMYTNIETSPFIYFQF